MVIQSKMSSEAIVDIWVETLAVFKKHNVPLTKKSLETVVQSDFLPLLLQELNSVVGSSTATCIEGG